MKVTITRGETVPLRFTLKGKNDAGAWIVPDFAGATPRLIMRSSDDTASTLLFDREGVFESVPDGIVSIPRQAGDFPGSGGQCGVWQLLVTYSNGTTEWFPKRPAPLEIVDDLA